MQKQIRWELLITATMYPSGFEVARTDFIKAAGISYTDVEKKESSLH